MSLRNDHRIDGISLDLDCSLEYLWLEAQSASHSVQSQTLRGKDYLAVARLAELPNLPNGLLECDVQFPRVIPDELVDLS